jgi:hypothetical protein
VKTNESSIITGAGQPDEIWPTIREILAARTRQLALRAGRIPPQVSQVDYEDAKHELTGETDMDRQEAALKSLQSAMDVAAAAGGKSPLNILNSGRRDAHH